MSVDVFGRTLKKKTDGARGPPGVGFKLDSTGNFDLEGKILHNLSYPVEPSDAVNYEFLTTQLSVLKNELEKQILALETKLNQLQKISDHE